MDPIEQELREAGASWRASRPPAPDATFVRAALVASRQTSRNALRDLWTSLTVVSSLVVGLVLVWRQPFPGGSAGARSGSSIVIPGDRVVGVGLVFAALDKPIVLCRRLDIVGLGSASQSPCSQVAIELTGVDVNALKGATTEDGAISAPATVVRGVWNGSGMTVDTIGGGSPTTDASPPTLACGTPVAGATPEEGSALDIEAAYARLQTAIDGSPNTFAGEWVQTVGGNRLMAVATVVDEVQAATEIRAVFPYAFCVVHVDYSWTQLQNTASAFGDDPHATSDILTSANRVAVQLPVIDNGQAVILGRYPAAFAQPLVTRE
jgi:hypothetical protein